MMKKLILVVLLSVLLVLSNTSAVLAAPRQKTLTAQMTVMAVSPRDVLTVTPFINPVGELNFSITGPVTYIGTVTDATRDKKEDWKKLVGASIVAQETVNYVVDQNFTIIPGQGNVSGTITITGPSHATAVLTYQAQVEGNIMVGPAGDVGTWKAVQTQGALHILKDAAGTWTAGVILQEVAPGIYTLAGTATVTGTY